MNEKPFCASSPEARNLSDDEFWAKVYQNLDTGPDYDVEDSLPTPESFCLRCGRAIWAEDTEFCEDCVDEVREVDETFLWQQDCFGRIFSPGLDFEEFG